MPTDTLLLRLEGPLQSWGDAAARWDYRTTGPRPTKSGVLGLIANALGRDFDDPIDDLTALRFAVRADRPGHTELDLRIAGGGTFPLDNLTRWHNPKLDGDRINYGAPRASQNNSWTSNGRSGVFRTTTYLADAAFLASVTGDRQLLADIAAALTRPARQLFLGRRAHPMSRDPLYCTLDGDRHHQWPNEEPLLDTYTHQQPRTWTETDTPTHGLISYEQPATGLRRGAPQHPLTLTTTIANPPAPTPAGLLPS